MTWQIGQQSQGIRVNERTMSKREKKPDGERKFELEQDREELARTTDYERAERGDRNGEGKVTTDGRGRGRDGVVIDAAANRQSRV